MPAQTVGRPARTARTDRTDRSSRPARTRGLLRRALLVARTTTTSTGVAPGDASADASSSTTLTRPTNGENESPPAGPATRGRPRSARTAVHRLRRDTAILVALAVLLAVSGLGLQQYRMTVLTADVEPQLMANQELLQAATEMEAGVRGYRLARNPTFLEPYEAAQPSLHDALSALQNGAVDAGVRPSAHVQQEAIGDWLLTVSNPTARSADVEGDLTASTAAFDRVRVANAAVSDQLLLMRDQLRRQARITTTVGIAVLVGVGLFGLALLRRRSRLTLRQVVPPLEQLRDVVGELGRGRTGTRADTDHGVEEIRTVATAVNRLAEANREQRAALDAQIALNDEVRTISGLTQSTLDIPSIVTHSARSVAVGLRADAVWIRAFDGSGQQPSRGWAAFHPVGPPPSTPLRLIGAVREIAVGAWHRQTDVLLEPGGSDDGLIGPEDHAGILEILDHDDRDTLLITPVGVGPECLGYLAMSRDRHRPQWSGPERQAAQRIGRDLGRSILTARLFERERELVEELRALDDSKDQFVSTASHELRTPLTAIVGHIQLVSHGTLGPVPAELAPSIAAVDRNAKRLQLLIDDLLALSRLGQATPLREADVDLVQLVDEVVSVHRFAAELRRIRIEIDSDGEPLDVHGNEEELERALSNTIGNAVKFSPSGGVVKVDVRQAPPGAEITVTDVGIGISAADQELLFTRFFRSTNPEALAISGTGLGLTITRSIVEKHHGTVRLESTLGQGTVVRILLPTHRATAH